MERKAINLPSPVILEGAEAQAGDRLPQTAWPDVEGGWHTHDVVKIDHFLSKAFDKLCFQGI